MVVVVAEKVGVRMSFCCSDSLLAVSRMLGEENGGNGNKKEISRVKLAVSLG